MEQVKAKKKSRKKQPLLPAETSTGSASVTTNVKASDAVNKPLCDGKAVDASSQHTGDNCDATFAARDDERPSVHPDNAELPLYAEADHERQNEAGHLRTSTGRVTEAISEVSSEEPTAYDNTDLRQSACAAAHRERQSDEELSTAQLAMAPTTTVSPEVPTGELGTAQLAVAPITTVPSEVPTEELSTAQLAMAPISTVEPEVPTAPDESFDGHYAFPSSPGTRSAVRFHISGIEESAAVTSRSDDSLGRNKSVGRLYPELSEVPDNRTSMRPFTEEQIMALYENAWLKERTTIVSEFVSLNQEKRLNHHELYKLLESYRRSRELLVATVCTVRELVEHIGKHETCVWDIVPDVVTGKGRCADNKRVTGEHYFQRALYNDDVASLMASSSQKLLKLLREKHVLYMHNASTLRVQIDYYFQLILDIATFRDIPKNMPISTGTQPQLTEGVAELRTCISVLFVFLRKAVQDEVFVNDVQSWLRMLASLLLRVASLADHFFLLSHVLRCPPGIHKWAISLVQVPSPLPWPEHTDWHQATLGCPQLDYALAALATVMSPIEQREEYLQPLQSALEAAAGQDPWVVLDSDGEEDEPPSVVHWRENDVVALVNQVPFAAIFQHLLFVIPEDYDVTRSSERSILKLIAVASQLVSIFHTGLKTYNHSKYRQLTKRISRLIRHTVQYVSDHWRSFRLMQTQSASDSALLMRLQVEYDQFFLRAVNCIFYSQSTGAWQFMAVLPYTSVSTVMLWQLLWLLHNSYQEEVQQTLLAPSEICEKLQDKGHKLCFEEKLCNMLQSEVFFLMTSFANMAASREEEGRAFTHIVAIEIFQITYLNRNIRQQFAKEGRDLLSSLAQKQPCVVSVLLDAIDDHMMALGIMACYLMQAMPLHLWLPDKQDLDVIAHFLLYYPLDSPQSQLARLLIENLNYGFGEQGQLFLDQSLHQQLALLLLEAYEKICVPFEAAGYVYKQVRYLSYLATGTGDSSTPMGFVSWTWTILFRLKLHAFDSNHQGQLHLILDENPPQDIAPDLEQCEWLHPIFRASKDLCPPAIFLSISVGSVGHYREQVLTTGLKLLSTLTLGEQFAAAVKCICHILPLFYLRQEMLTTSQQFLEDLQRLVLADNTYLAAAKSLVGSEQPGCVLKQLAATMTSHVCQAKHWGFPSLPIKLWILLLFHLPDIPMHRAMYKTKGRENVMYLLDVLVQLAYFEADCLDSVIAQFTELLANLTVPAASQSMVRTVFSYVLGSQIASWPAIVPLHSVPQFPWFALAGMLAEAQLPEVASAWKAFLSNIAQLPQVSVDIVVRKTMQAPVDVLLLYRWAHQALQTKGDHQALPLIWQQFFFLYLQRCPNGNSVGPRFFESAKYFPLLKKIKQRLNELADHCFQQCAIEEGPSKNLCELLLKMYRTFGLWLEEPRLQTTSIDFSALPSQYCPEALCSIIQGNNQLWHQLVSMEKGRHELQSLHLAEEPHISRPCRNRQPCEDAPEERIISRLKTYEGPMPAPAVPTLRPIIPAVPCLAPQVQELVSTQLRVLLGHASTVTDQLDKLTKLDRVCREELLPALYDNVSAFVHLAVPCDYHEECKGPLHLRLQYYEARQATGILHNIEQNRTEWIATLTELQRPPPHASCCAHVQLEACLTQLVQRHRQASSANKEALEALGSQLFFDLVGSLHKEIVEHAPTRQFITLCLDMVGEEFVSNRANQCLPVLLAILNDPSIVGHVAPFFSPTSANEDQYALMYQSVSSCIVPRLYNAVFVLLSKFELPCWLTSCQPNRAVREQLLESVEVALCKCGINPPQALLPLVEVFHVHLHNLLRFHFPEHYTVVLAMLLRGTVSCSIPVATWGVFLQALGYCMPDEVAMAYDEEYAKHQCFLSLAETTDTINATVKCFAALRKSDASTVKNGLYSRVKPFLPVLPRFFAVTAHCYIWENLKAPDDNLQEAAKTVLLLYGPWLELSEGKSVCAPWLPGDTEEAAIMANSLAAALTFLHRCCHNTWNVNVLSLVWQHYFVKYVWTNPPEYVIVALQAALTSLPWSQFSPCVDDMRLACKLLEGKYSSHLDFLVKVFVEVPWKERLHHAQQLMPECVVEYYSCFAELVATLAWREDMTTFIASTLGSLYVLEWGILPVELVHRIQKIFACNCDVHQLVKQSSCTSRTMLEFVTVVSCMVPGSSSRDPSKQLAFVSLLVELYGPALQIADVQDVALLLPQLLDQCQSVQSSVAILGRALSLLDSASKGSTQEQALRGSLLPWLDTRSGHPVLLAILAAACTNLASVHHLVFVTEACLSAFFEGNAAADGGWRQAAGAFRVPELTVAVFREECACQAAHLTQLCYVLYCLPQCRCPEDERILLDQLADWVSQGRAGGESEPKLLLLWAKLLALSFRQLDFGSSPQAVDNLLANVCSTLSILGEDRDTGGLLGALGMGRRSTVSLRFRFCCRAVAAFVAARLVDNTVLASQTLSRLQILQTTKAYMPLQQEIQEALNLVQDSSLTLRDSLHLIQTLVNFFYCEKAYLRILFFGIM
nr:ectopic P granules protein 5 homolog [Dermacentor andersoni]